MKILYGCPNTRSLRAAWALEECGLEYEYRRIDLFRGEGRRPEFLAINDQGKVPVLIDDGMVLTESGAIVTHLGERHAPGRLVPVEAAGRAAYFRWLFFAATELEQPLWTIVKHRFGLPAAQRRPDVEPTARWEFNRALAALAPVFAREPYVTGPEFTGADILVWHSLAWAGSLKIDLANAALDDYVTRLRDRPSLLRARERER